MRTSWLGSLVQWLEEHFYANEIFDPDKMTGNQFYSDLANLVDKRSQIIFPGKRLVKHVYDQRLSLFRTFCFDLLGSYDDFGRERRQRFRWSDFI